MKADKKGYVKARLSPLFKQQWLQGSTAKSHEYLKLEQLENWESLDSSSVARYGAMIQSQFSLFNRDESRN